MAVHATEWNWLSTDVGEWCPDCMLPSVFTERWIRTLVDDPTRVVERREMRECFDCGRRIPPAARDAV